MGSPGAPNARLFKPHTYNRSCTIMDTAWQMPVWDGFATEKGRPVEREDAGEAGLRGSALSANR